MIKRKHSNHGHMDLLARLEVTETGWRIVGDMNFASVPVLLVQGRNLLQHHADIEIDLIEVDHVDSAGLVLMLEWIDISREAGGSISFLNIPDDMVNMSRLCNVEDLLFSVGLPPIQENGKKRRKKRRK